MSETAGEGGAVKLVSIVAIDMVGFSTLTERDQHKAARKVEALRARIIRVADRHGGRLFNTAGDGFMLEFVSAGAAFEAIVQLLDRRPWGEPRLRIGAHVGDVIVTATGDLIGHGVNVAARLQQLAAPGTALVSLEFRSMAQTSPHAFQARGQKPLDNMEQRVQTFEILSSRQRLARTSSKLMTVSIAGAALAGAVYFAPAAWRLVQPYLPTSIGAGQSEAEAESLETSALPAAAPAQPTFTAGHIIRDCENCPELVVLAGGAFLMGSPDGEPNRGRDEGPQREVAVAPFAIGKFEVTFAQWDACLADGGCNGYSPPDRGWGRGDRPVTDVSWNDVQAYLDWLNAETGGLRYRLATEAEWEYAARAGGAEAYAFGPRVAATQATFGVGRTTPVGQHPANAFALFDMHGNVGEWVEDCYAASYEGAPADGLAVQDENCRRRVFRGGNFADRPSVLRAASRRFGPPTQRVQGVGFRVARTLD